MGVEIERKFLLRNDDWRTLPTGEAVKGVPFRQGYLASGTEATVRVRLQGDSARLTIKGKTDGVSRAEFEYTIPVEEAQVMLDTLCRRPLIEKVRYCRKENGLTWEIDEFMGDNAGLLVAEVELESEDQVFTLPDWVGEEVSGDERYYNVNLVAYPFKDWSAQ